MDQSLSDLLYSTKEKPAMATPTVVVCQKLRVTVHCYPLATLIL